MRASTTFSLNHEQVYNLLKTTGHTVTYMIEGDIGCGKSHTLTTFAERKPLTPSGLEYAAYVYFDGSTKDVGDVIIPDLVSIQKADDSGMKVIRFIPNEELGFQFDGPIVLMVDEAGKMEPPVKNAMMRVFNEKKLGPYTLHHESIVFGATNLGAEGTGDLFLPHHNDRKADVRLLKGSNLDWINWAINNGVDDMITSFAFERPEMFQSFTDVPNPDDNPYIYHPQAPERTAFVTNRSLARASYTVANRHLLDDVSLHASLIGQWGGPAAADFMATLHLKDKMPSLADIIRDPMNANIPDNNAAQCAMVYRTLRNMTHELIQPWMRYLSRLPHGTQSLFAGAVSAPHYKHAGIPQKNTLYRDWSMANRHLFAADVVI